MRSGGRACVIIIQTSAALYANIVRSGLQYRILFRGGDTHTHMSPLISVLISLGIGFNLASVSIEVVYISPCLSVLISSDVCLRNGIRYH